MKLFLKLSFNSIKKNKIRYLLLVCTLLLSTVIMLSTVIIKDSAIKIREDQLRESTLNSQLLITKSDEKDPLFNPDEVIDSISDIDGITNVVPRIGGIVHDNENEVQVNLIGVDLVKQSETFEIDLIDEQKIEEDENQVIINEKYANEKSLKLGSKIKLKSRDIEKEFTVSKIAKNTGVFMGNMNTAMINIKDAQDLFKAYDKSYSVGITIGNLNEINNVIESIDSKISSDFIVEQKYDLDYVKSYVGTIDMALKIISVLSIFITLFLTYSTFALTIYERLHQIGILRSLGITKRDIGISVIVENLLIVLSSIIIGSLLTVPFIKIILSYIVHDTYFTLDLMKFLLIDLSIIIFSTLVILISLKNILNMSVISLLKGVGKAKCKNKIKKRYKYFFATVALIASIVILAYESKYQNGVPLLIAGAILCIISFILLAEALLFILNKLFQKISYLFRSKISILFKELIMQFFNIVDIVIIISVIICSMYISVTLKSMINNGVTNVYQSADIMLTVDSSVKEDFEEKIKSIDYIEDSAMQLRTTDFIKDKKVEISGIDGTKYKQSFSSEIIKQGGNEIFDKLNDGKNIIITTTFSKNTGVKLNDSLKIKDEEYTVIGIISSFENMGGVLFISDDNFKEDIKVKDKDMYLLQVRSDDEVKATIEKIDELFKGKYEQKYSVQELSVLNEKNNENNEKIFNIVNILICISTCICVISMSNNVTINILSRKKVFATKRALGISKGCLCKFIILESIILGIYSGLFGLGLGAILSNYINKILSYYIGDMVFINNYMIMTILFAISIGISVISYIYPLRKLSKINIIDEIKSDE